MRESKNRNVCQLSIGAPQGSSTNAKLAERHATDVFRDCWTLLPRHGDTDGIFRLDEVIYTFGRIGDRQLNPFDEAVETVTDRTVILGHGRAAVLADIATVIGREHHREGHRDCAFPDLLAVRVQGHCAALTQATTCVRKLHPHLALPFGNCVRGLDVEVLHTTQVVTVLELPALGIQAPAANVAALTDDDAFGAALGYDDLRADRVRFILEVKDAVLG